MKLTLGYYSDITQRTPKQALEYAVTAEKEGFDSIWTGDHFHPWVHTGAKCGFAWVWFGSLGERTSRVMFGTGLTAPTIRYHPAIVAQAFATLGDMYPGRVFIALGTGEAMNELPLGLNWPGFKERAARLEEAIKVMRLLWTKEFVNFRGQYYRLKGANLYTKPQRPIPIYVAANGPKIAEMAGRHADGFLTLPFPDSHYKDVLFPALEKGARDANRDPSKIERLMELQMAYDEDYDYWKPNGRLIRVRPNGQSESLIGGNWHFPNGLAISPKDAAVFMIETTAADVLRIPVKKDGMVGAPEIYAQFPGNILDGLAFAKNGNLYVSCYLPNRI